ncbi:Alpha/Beta hydrolase protein [Leucosporidium creatinivorum]|uniref:Alpha/Beta hydrolase protein n=1 Tax=Leucosporidium creatinivorum TaxID=106004 RepID=A0A1Y2F136_9BASI|nr:Alpha/Beta hydrolase protein [Leucosporidium creatinivorum]
MTAKQATPYGSWSTPITTTLVTSSAISLAELAATPSSLIWVESRPEEAGRSALVYQKLGSDSKAEEVTPDQKWNVRTRVHEYGGASFALSGEDVVFSTVEGPVYKVSRKASGSWSEPVQVSPPSDVLRFANFHAHPTSPSLLLTVVEDHTNDKPSTVVNTLGLLDVSSPSPALHPIASGADFYSTPQWSPSGKYLSWIQWNHPDMPWEGSELWVAQVNRGADGKVVVEQAVLEGSARKIAGEKGNVESVSQARWALEEDTLVFLSDRTDFYELYRFEEGKNVELLLSEPTNSDVGSPDWTLGASTHAPLDTSTWISKAKDGNLRLINLSSKSSTVVPTPYAAITELRVISSTQLAVLASPPDAPALLAILAIDGSASTATPTIIKLSSSASVDKDYISVAEHISYPTRNDLEAYALYYPPLNKRHVGKEGELPPLVVKCHGGPTGSARQGLDWNTQFFTSRGFAVVDVNYGGSTGYGRDYRNRLAGQWGIVDVEDTIACVEHLISTGQVDKKRVAITGGSAGGYTVLAALCKGDVFGAGTSHYGISDLKMLADDTHKFESQYLFALLGGTPKEVPENYRGKVPSSSAFLLR